MDYYAVSLYAAIYILYSQLHGVPSVGSRHGVHFFRESVSLRYCTETRSDAQRVDSLIMKVLTIAFQEGHADLKNDTPLYDWL